MLDMQHQDRTSRHYRSCLFTTVRHGSRGLEENPIYAAEHRLMADRLRKSFVVVTSSSASSSLCVSCTAFRYDTDDSIATERIDSLSVRTAQRVTFEQQSSAIEQGGPHPFLEQSSYILVTIMPSNFNENVDLGE